MFVYLVLVIFFCVLLLNQSVFVGVIYILPVRVMVKIVLCCLFIFTLIFCGLVVGVHAVPLCVCCVCMFACLYANVWCRHPIPIYSGGQPVCTCRYEYVYAEFHQ